MTVDPEFQFDLSPSDAKPRWTIDIPLHVVSRANTREHWRKTAERVRREKAAVALAWRGSLINDVRLPCIVTFTRFGTRSCDSDNLASAFKAPRDQVAKELCVDDGDPRVEWRYQQRAPASYAIRIEIQEVDRLIEHCGCGGILDPIRNAAGTMIDRFCRRCGITAGLPATCRGCKREGPVRSDGYCTEACSVMGPADIRSWRSLGS